MKNIHVLPTENSSRLSYNKDGILELHRLQWRKNTQNIYITSDEEIKIGDWYLIEFNGLKITQCTSVEELISIEGRDDCKKIILTTDQDLIKDGVQAIDDEFLEWFVKNPSCESVEIKIWFDTSHISLGIGRVYHNNPNKPLYKIIIPKEELKPLADVNWQSEIISKVWDEEEPKQEPGKETADYIDRHIVEALVEVAKQKMYSEEEVEDLIYKVCGTVARLQGITLNGNHIDTAYKKFKKK